MVIFENIYYIYPLLLLIIGLFYRKFNSLIKKTSVFILVLGASLASVHLYQNFGSTDFTNYYNDYFSVVQNNVPFTSIMRLYFSGLEPGLPLFYNLLIFFPVLSPDELAFTFSFILFSLFARWLIVYGIKYTNTRDPGYILALSFGMVSMTLGTQLFRQGLSSVILLFCLSQSGKGKKIGLLLLATLVHSTALPIFFFINYFIKKKEKSILFLSITTAIIIYLFRNDIILFLSNYYDKIIPENILSMEISDVEIGTLKWIILSFFIILSSKFIILSKKSTAFPLVLGGTQGLLAFTLLFFFFIDLPLISTRLTLIYSMLLIGYINAFFLDNSENYYKILILFTIAIYKFYSLKI